MSLKLKSELEAALSALWNKDKALLVAHNDAASGAHGMSAYGKQVIASANATAMRNALGMASDQGVTFKSLTLAEGLTAASAAIGGLTLAADGTSNFSNYASFSKAITVGGATQGFVVDQAQNDGAYNSQSKTGDVLAISKQNQGLLVGQHDGASWRFTKDTIMANSPILVPFATIHGLAVTGGIGGQGTIIGRDGASGGASISSAVGDIVLSPFTGGIVKLTSRITAPSATFSEAIEAGGYSYFGKTDANAGIRTRQLSIRDDVIENYLTDSDTAGVSINYAGFNGANTRFRDFIVYNGKYGRLFKITGSTGVAEFSGRLTATDVLATKQGSDTDLGYKLGPDNWPQRNLIGHVYTEALSDHVIISVPRGETAESAKLKFTWRGALSGISNLYADAATINGLLTSKRGVFNDAPLNYAFIGTKPDGSAFGFLDGVNYDTAAYGWTFGQSNSNGNFILGRRAGSPSGIKVLEIDRANGNATFSNSITAPAATFSNSITASSATIGGLILPADKTAIFSEPVTFGSATQGVTVIKSVPGGSYNSQTKDGDALTFSKDGQGYVIGQKDGASWRFSADVITSNKPITAPAASIGGATQGFFIDQTPSDGAYNSQSKAGDAIALSKLNQGLIVGQHDGASWRFSADVITSNKPIVVPSASIGGINVLNGLSQVGEIKVSPVNKALTGTFICDGSAVSRAQYPKLYAFIGDTFHTNADGDHFNLPDYRGVFLRGLDSGRGLDSNRTIGATPQEDMLEHHNHDYYSSNMGITNSGTPHRGIYDDSASNTTVHPTSYTGGTETRPVNMAVVYCIVHD